MKKTLLFLMSSLALVFASCKDDNDDDDQKKPNNEKVDNIVPDDKTGLSFKYDESTMTATVSHSDNYHWNEETSLFEGENYGFTEVKIPSKVQHNGKVYDVTKIGWNAFDGCTSLTSIVIPESVTEFEGNTFWDCISLTSIEIPNSVTYIGKNTFNYCTSLTSIVIPESVTKIEDGTFDGCTSLTSIEIPSSVTKIGSFAFDGCTSLKTARVPLGCDIGKIAFPSTCEIVWYGEEETIAVPAEETGLSFEYYKSTMTATVSCSDNYHWNEETFLFEGENYGFTEVKIPSKVLFDGKVYDVTEIGGFAFGNCQSLTSIEIPNSITYIGENTFYYCTSLTSIVIPESVTKIGLSAFKGCTSLKTARVPLGCDIKNAFPSTCEIVWYGEEEKIAVPAEETGLSFGYNESTMTAAVVYSEESKEVTEVKIPSKVLFDGKVYDVTEIGSFAFGNCQSLTSIEIPNSITTIGLSAFAYCESLTNIEIPNSVTVIKRDAFDACTSLKTARVPVSLKDNISSNVFPSTCEIEWY